ncbi:MAG: ubiquinone biosynthesis protein [Actinomycetota bacterium]|nr:ubiquinone biosynthesis protein [Actinomycetota bacterium]
MRLAQIVVVIARHGLGSLVGLVGSEHHAATRWIGHRLGDRLHSPPEHVRMALEELGTTFVKLGQVLSTRGDLFPPLYQAELARLQDEGSPEPVEAVRAVVAAELGHPVEELYLDFEPEPLASASIGQAHAATTVDGVSVVVKVRHSAVVQEVERDLVLLERLARRVSNLWADGPPYDLVGLTREFSATLRAELDYLREADNAEHFAATFAHDPTVHIPAVFRRLSTSRVLTLERVRGTKVTDDEGLEAAGMDRAALARRAAEMELKMVFEDGFFHADPHPGNFFIEADGRIGLIDFGMVGTVDAQTKLRLVRVIGALVIRDGDGLVDAFLELGIAGAVVDRPGLRADLLALAQDYLDRPLGEVSLAVILRELLAVVRSHRLHLPPNLALLVKTIAMCEGVGAQLDPDFRMTDVLLPFVQRVLVESAASTGGPTEPAAVEGAPR